MTVRLCVDCGVRARTMARGRCSHCIMAHAEFYKLLYTLHVISTSFG